MGSSISISKTRCDESTKANAIIDEEPPFLPEAPPELYRPASFDEKMYEKVRASCSSSFVMHRIEYFLLRLRGDSIFPVP